MRDESKPEETDRPKRSTTRSVATLGLVSGAALGMSAGEVMATIIDFGSVPLVLNWGTNGSATTNLNLDSTGGNDLALWGSAGGMMGRVNLLPLGMMLDFNVLTNGSGLVAPLAYGATIGTQPSSSFGQPLMGGIPFLEVMYNVMNMTYSTQGSFNLSSPQYFGFQFSYNGTLVNAWGLLSITGGPLATQIELLGGSFEDSGGSITAGAAAPIPEPGTGVLLALGLGALGVRSMRLRKKERTARAAEESSSA